MRVDSNWSSALLKLVTRLNNFNYKDAQRSDATIYYKLFVGNKAVGLVEDEVQKQLVKYPDVFVISQETRGEHSCACVRLHEGLTTVEDRDIAVGRVLEDLRVKDCFITLKGWRDETFSIYHLRTEEPVLHIERSACCLFGMLQYGVHINGYTYKDGQLMMWIGRRSKTKQTYPSMLDNMCAGGLTSGLGMLECAIKECQEEASVDDKSLEKLKSVGCVSYCFTDERGLHPETEYIFDLELSPDFVPLNSDGEMEKFYLYTIEEIQDLIVNEEFKPNCGLVVVDFLIRHGYITHDNEPNYLYLQEKMHVSLQPDMPTEN